MRLQPPLFPLLNPLLHLGVKLANAAAPPVVVVPPTTPPAAGEPVMVGEGNAVTDMETDTVPDMVMVIDMVPVMETV